MARQVTGAIAFPAGVAVGVGVGGAVSGALEPRLRALQNEAWSRFESMPLQAIEAAQLVAHGERGRGWGLAEAGNVGVNAERFDALVDMLDTALEQGLLMEAFRRGIIDEGRFRRGAKRHGIEDEWIDVLVRLRARVLSPAEAASARQQGYIDETRQKAEAALSGVSGDRAELQFQMAGLPPGPEAALAMLRRGVIDSGEFEQMIREGNTKTKYTDEYLRLRRVLLTAQEWAGLWLRGWATEEEAKVGGAQVGYEPEDVERLYLNRGRPATTRQVHIGWQRGGRLAGAANEREAFTQAVRQSNIRPEYEPLLWAQRHTYPSAFVVRALAADGTFDRTTTERILLESGWAPEYAELAAGKWAGDEETGPPTKWADRARTRLFTTLRNEYLDGSVSDEQVRDGLARVGAAPAEVGPILALWAFENSIARKELTDAVVKKLYKLGRRTYEEAIDALLDRGYTPDDADDFLTT